MKFLLYTLGSSVEIAATSEGLTVGAADRPLALSRREDWPADARSAPGWWSVATAIEVLLEASLAEEREGRIVVPYENFETIDADMPVGLLRAWTKPSPFLLKIDRKSDLGRSDFQYKYQFLMGSRPVFLDRLGFYVKRAGSEEVFILDRQMYGLVRAMERFNGLPAASKTPQQSWLTFASVKGCAREVGAVLDSTLAKNDVVIPSTIGLDMHEDSAGALSFLPKCPELATEEFQGVFERNLEAEKLYSLDRPGLGKVRIVLTNEQHEVLQRMKRVRRLVGEAKESLKENPFQAFDGVTDHVDIPVMTDLPYSDRVIGIGGFQAAAVPKSAAHESVMDGLATEADATGADSAVSEDANPAAEIGLEEASAGAEAAAPVEEGPEREEPDEAPEIKSKVSSNGHASKDTPGSYVLLIKINETDVDEAYREEAASACTEVTALPYQRPKALRGDRKLRKHQEVGVQWLQTCVRVDGRRGVLLADDMGVGKTLQILTFLAWCIESRRFPELSKDGPPYRPILIVAPLILIENETWVKEMEQFFVNDGAIFRPVQFLHSGNLDEYRRGDAERAEDEIGRPALDLRKLQENRVVITNYETLRNYQTSLAYHRGGKSLWSLVVSDEAQEYKIPSSKLSHAMKSLRAPFHIACTGTPVENRLLDLWNICDVFQPAVLSSAKEFAKEFEVRDTSAQAERLKKLKSMLLFQKPHAFLKRRNKSEVGELPEKRVLKILCQMSEEEIGLHRQLVRSLREGDNREQSLTVLHRLAFASQHPALLRGNAEDLPVEELIAGSSKLRKVIEQLHAIRAKGEKVLIFARSREMQSILAKVLEQEFRLPVRIVNGETKRRITRPGTQGVKTRSEILNAFKTRAGFDVLILSPFVAGVGLTIVEANHVFHYGRWWNPAVEAQATDRVYRLGQTKPVSVYVPILRDETGQIAVTFDERLDQLLERRYRLAEDFLSPLPEESANESELLNDLRAGAV